MSTGKPRWIWGAMGVVGTKMAWKLGCRKNVLGGDDNNTWKGNCEYLKGGYSEWWERLQQSYENRNTSYRQQIRVGRTQTGRKYGFIRTFWHTPNSQAMPSFSCMGLLLAPTSGLQRPFWMQQSWHSFTELMSEYTTISIDAHHRRRARKCVTFLADRTG